MKQLSKSIFPSDNKLNKILLDFIGGMPIEDIVSKHGAGLYYPIDLLEQIVSTGSPVVTDGELKRLCDYHFFFQEAARMRRKLIKNKLTQKED
jgi:hypothetical protein